MTIELGIKLANTANYYDKLLKKAGLYNVLNCATRDIYYTNKKLDGLSEKEMKKACVRVRAVRVADSNNNFLDDNKAKKYQIQNYSIFKAESSDVLEVNDEELQEQLEEFKKQGWKMVFDTKKMDHQYAIGNKRGRIQIQEIADIGVMLYYDNPDYADMDSTAQRKALIDELNSYGFSFNYDVLNLDKLRTLYYKKECFSME